MCMEAQASRGCLSLLGQGFQRLSDDPARAPKDVEGLKLGLPLAEYVPVRSNASRRVVILSVNFRPRTIRERVDVRHLSAKEQNLS
jgi:hypothetical protein